MPMLLYGNGTISGATSFPTAASFGSTLSVTGALTQSSGAAFSLASGQLAFPATQNASSDANTLDDYEEGTWTPSYSWGTGTATTATIVSRYVKIGRLVTVNIRFTVSGASSTANLLIGGLPFAFFDSIADSSSIVREYLANGIFWGFSFGSATSIYMHRYDNNNAVTNGNTAYSGTLTYFTST